MVVMDCGVELSGPLSARDYKDAGTDGMNKNSAKMIPVIQETVGTLCADSHPDSYTGQDAYTGRLVPQQITTSVYENHPADSRVKELGDVCSTVTSRWGTGGGNLPMVSQPIAFEPGKLKRLGYGDAEPGLAPSLRAQAGDNQLAVAFNIAPGKGELKDDIHVTDAYIAKTIDASGSNPSMHQGGAAIVQPIPFDTTQITSKANYSKPQQGDPCHPLAAGAHPPAIVQPIGVDIFNAAFTGEVSVPLTRRSDGTGTGPTVMQPLGTDLFNGTITGNISMTLKRGDGNPAINLPTVMQSMAVRRLTPKECERLQGFPDNYTDIKPKGKPTPDGPRYKALGNSMAVPVMAWIGKRIQEVENIK
jgi:DNA (cytosine-5)-methyltransferase 1